MQVAIFFIVCRRGNNYLKWPSLHLGLRGGPFNSFIEVSSPSIKEGGVCCGFVSYPLIAATPGSTLPSIASRRAPPPVEM